MSTVGLEFVEEGHRYIEDGIVIPSVSQVLALTGIDDVSAVPVYHLRKAAERGTAVHLACNYLDEDDLNIESLDPEIVGYVVAYQKFREEYFFTAELIEHRMVGEVDGMRYGMCLDRLGTIERDGESERVLLDIKTASKPQKSWPIQTAAYMVGYSAKDRLGPPSRAVVHLKKDATYTVLRHTLESDHETWSAALRLAYWKIANGYKVP